MTEKAGSFVLPPDMTAIFSHDAGKRSSGVTGRILSSALLVCAWVIGVHAMEDEILSSIGITLCGELTK
jgi:hypothetical protein